ncbi:MAG: hypothetical protein WA672_01890, partial [Candidatus Angelobacter sp.]
LREAIIASVRELSGRNVATRLYTLTVNKPAERRRIVPFQGSEGDGFLGSDGTSVVFTFSGGVGSAPYTVWIGNLETGELRQLTHLTDPRMWDAEPALSPDGKQVLFIRFRRSAMGIHAQPMLIDLQSGAVSQFLEESDGILALAYAHDGKHLALWSKNGLERAMTDGKERTVILPASEIIGMQYYSSGISWSRSDEKIVFAIFNKRSAKYELIELNRSDGRWKAIYSVSGFEIRRPSFVSAS